MKRPLPLVLLLVLCFLAPLGGCAGTRAAPAASSPVTETTSAERRPASEGELERYAERERQSRGLEDFKGGRRGIQATTIIIILLAVIVILILV